VIAEIPWRRIGAPGSRRSLALTWETQHCRIIGSLSFKVQVSVQKTDANLGHFLDTANAEGIRLVLRHPERLLRGHELDGHAFHESL
jgi:hypothetical protein